jgi:hypothetical protein
MQGASSVTETLHAQRGPTADVGHDKPVKIFPVVTRVELAEIEKLSSARKQIAEQFSECLWHVAPEHRAEF